MIKAMSLFQVILKVVFVLSFTVDTKLHFSIDIPLSTTLIMYKNTPYTGVYIRYELEIIGQQTLVLETIPVTILDRPVKSIELYLHS